MLLFIVKTEGGSGVFGIRNCQLNCQKIERFTKNDSKIDSVVKPNSDYFGSKNADKQTQMNR